MSLLQFDFESQYLNNNTTISVILPDRPKSMDAEDFYGSGKKYKVLWLLHGTFGDHSDWVRKSMIGIYAREKNLICVMPSGMNADYVSWPKFGLGYDVESHIIKELRPMIYHWFPASDKREDNFIAGLSMGGDGAFGLAMKHPECFGGVAVLSGIRGCVAEADWEGTDTNPRGLTINNPRFINQVENAGGREAFVKNYDYQRMMFELYEQGKLPNMIFGCGTKDPGYENYCKFRDKCQKKGIPAVFEELPDLGHEWRFWDPFIQIALRFFKLETDCEKQTLL